MNSLTKKIISMGVSMQVDELLLLEYAIVAVGVDPDKIQIDGKYYVSLKREYVQKYLPEVVCIQGSRYINCVNSLVKNGFIQKKIHADNAYYTSGPEMENLLGFTFLTPVVEAAAKSRPAATQLTLDERKKIFAQQAIEAAKQHNDSKPSYILTEEDLRNFIQYWTAPLQKQPNKMFFETEQTFVHLQRLRTSIAKIYAPNALKGGSVHRHPTVDENKNGIANVIIS